MQNNDKKNSPFKVPENYFDDFHKEMMAKIQSETKPNIVPLWKKVLPWSGIAAILCGVIVSISLLNTNKDNNIANSDAPEYTNKSEMYASSSDDDDYFMLFLEDEASRNSYNEYIYTNLSN